MATSSSITHGIDPANPVEHWRAKALKEKTEAGLTSLRSELATIVDLLTRAEAILQDFSPPESRLSKPGEFRSAITYEGVAAFGA